MVTTITAAVISRIGSSHGLTFLSGYVQPSRGATGVRRFDVLNVATRRSATRRAFGTSNGRESFTAFT